MEIYAHCYLIVYLKIKLMGVLFLILQSKYFQCTSDLLKNQSRLVHLQEISFKNKIANRDLT